MPLISVIVPAYNHLDKVLLCLYSLRDLSNDKSNVEYLVQEDFSSDYKGTDVIDGKLVLNDAPGIGLK